MLSQTSNDGGENQSNGDIEIKQYGQHPNPISRAPDKRGSHDYNRCQRRCRKGYDSPKRPVPVTANIDGYASIIVAVIYDEAKNGAAEPRSHDRPEVAPLKPANSKHDEC